MRKISLCEAKRNKNSLRIRSIAHIIICNSLVPDEKYKEGDKT